MTSEPAALRTRPVPTCPLCGGEGTLRFTRLGDRLFGVPGTWNTRQCAAPACGLLWLDPVPLVEDLGKAYAAYFTHAAPPTRRPTALRRMLLAARRGYFASHFGGPDVGLAARTLGWLAWLHPGWRAELHHRAMHLQVRPGGRLLEVGCGAGALLDGVRGLGWQVTGVDFDAAAIDVARRSGFDVRQGDLAEQRFAAGSFDAVVMMHLFEHVPDPRALLAECRRILAPGGQIVVVTPNPQSRGLRRFGAAWMGLDPPRHLHLFPPAVLRREVERAGFAVDSVHTSLRDAEVMCAGSLAIERTGHYRFGAPIAAALRPRTLAFLYGSWLQKLVRGDVGEETVLVASTR